MRNNNNKNWKSVYRFASARSILETAAPPLAPMALVHVTLYTWTTPHPLSHPLHTLSSSSTLRFQE